MPLADLLASLIAERKRCNAGDAMCQPGRHCKRCARLRNFRDAKRPI